MKRTENKSESTNLSKIELQLINLVVVKKCTSSCAVIDVMAIGQQLSNYLSQLCPKHGTRNYDGGRAGPEQRR